jgi:putative holliday junction resolvase
MATVRAAAIDLGKARVGVAVTDELGLYAHPRPMIDGHDRKALLGALASLARDEGIRRFLVGLPLEMNGEQGPAARRAIAFAQALADASGVDVELVDERLTTVEAARRLREGGVSGRKNKARVDGAAAALLLQAWLDRD